MRRYIDSLRNDLAGFWRDRIVRAYSRDWDLLLVILLLSLSLRLYLAFAYDAGPTFGYEEEFTAAAEISPAQAPLYTIFLRVFTFFFGSGSRTAVCAVQSILISAGIMLLYYIATRMCGRRAGLAAAALGALYPGFIFSAISITPGLFITFVTIILMASLAGESAAGFRAVAAAVAAAAGVMLEPVMIFIVPGAIIALRRRLLFAAVLAVLLIPLTVLNSIVEKRPVPLYRAEAYGIDLGKFSPSKLRGRWHLVESIYSNTSVITSRGWAAEQEEMAEADRNSTYTAAYAYTMIMILGITGLARHYRRRHWRLMLPAVSYFLILMFLTVFAIRFRLVFEPLLVAYSASIIGGCRHEEHI